MQRTRRSLTVSAARSHRSLSAARYVMDWFGSRRAALARSAESRGSGGTRGVRGHPSMLATICGGSTSDRPPHGSRNGCSSSGERCGPTHPAGSTDCARSAAATPRGDGANWIRPHCVHHDEFPAVGVTHLNRHRRDACRCSSLACSGDIQPDRALAAPLVALEPRTQRSRHDTRGSAATSP
jgi:hypothetical protein